MRFGSYGGTRSVSGRIVQFGTSRFLQAHAALFAHEAREAGQDVGPITVVQTSGSPERAGRVAAFGAAGGYPVILRGIENGQPAERRVTVRSVEKGLSAHADWAELQALFTGDVAFVISNTGDRGYEIAAEDRGEALLSGAVPRSFPAKLTALLHHRRREGAAPITVLPCELISGNGDTLKRAVLDLAAAAGVEAGFAAYLEEQVLFANTLVDRIVSEPIEPIGAVAEHYGLWAIERQPGLVLPFEHPCIVLTDDLEPFERLKLHILNLGHTFLAEIWLSGGRAPDESVRAMLADPAVAEPLNEFYRTEIVPGFARRGMEHEARDYVAVTLERFANPFLDHRLSDIAQNHAAKIERRALAFRGWVRGAGDAPAMPRLESLIASDAARVGAP